MKNKTEKNKKGKSAKPNKAKNTPKKQNKASTPKTNKKPVAKKPATGKNKMRKQPKKRKNVSQKIPNGRTVQTRDEFFEGQSNYRKPGYQEKGFYRKGVVIDSNRANELVIVKLTTSEAGEKLPNYKNGKSKYRPFVETKDNKGNPITIGAKFIENPPTADLSIQDVNKIKKDAFVNSSNRVKKENKKKVRKMKGRQ